MELRDVLNHLIPIILITLLVSHLVGCYSPRRKTGYIILLVGLLILLLNWPKRIFTEHKLFPEEKIVYHDYESNISYIAMIPLAICAFELGRVWKKWSDRQTQKQKDEKLAMQAEYNQGKKQLEEKYGELTREFNFPSDELCKVPKVSESVFVFEKSQKLIIGNECYDFADIVECRLIDKLQGETILTTKTSTGSMIGRAVVGGVLTGGVGAVVGAATAKQKTIAKPTGNNDFEIMLSVNSIKNPIVKIPCGKHSDSANELYAILNLIIKNYQ